MIVAMTVMVVMKPTVYQIVEMIAVRYFFMPAIIVVANARGLFAIARIGFADRQYAFVKVGIVRCV